MFIQIAVGTGLLLVNITLAAVVLEVIFQWAHPWPMREPHRRKLTALLVEALRQIRLGQVEHRRKREG